MTTCYCISFASEVEFSHSAKGFAPCLFQEPVNHTFERVYVEKYIPTSVMEYVQARQHDHTLAGTGVGVSLFKHTRPNGKKPNRNDFSQRQGQGNMAMCSNAVEARLENNRAASPKSVDQDDCRSQLRKKTLDDAYSQWESGSGKRWQNGVEWGSATETVGEANKAVISKVVSQAEQFDADRLEYSKYKTYITCLINEWELTVVRFRSAPCVTRFLAALNQEKKREERLHLPIDSLRQSGKSAIEGILKNMRILDVYIQGIYADVATLTRGELDFDEKYNIALFRKIERIGRIGRDRNICDLTSKLSMLKLLLRDLLCNICASGELYGKIINFVTLIQKKTTL